MFVDIMKKKNIGQGLAQPLAPPTLHRICMIPITFEMPMINHWDLFTLNLFSSKTPSTIYTDM